MCATDFKKSVDLWTDLSINTIGGGAYSMNNMLMHKLNLLEKIEADDEIQYLLTGRYDCTNFEETGHF